LVRTVELHRSKISPDNRCEPKSGDPFAARSLKALGFVNTRTLYERTENETRTTHNILEAGQQMLNLNVVKIFTFLLWIFFMNGCSTGQEMTSTVNTNVQVSNKEDANIRYQLIEGNPIDEAFKKDFEIASATPELNFLANSYLDAWKSEWDNITNMLINNYEFVEDRDAIKAYKVSFEEFSQRAFDVEWLNYTDTTVPPGTRKMIGTGAISLSLLEEAYTYKRQVLVLIDRYYLDNQYSFIYKGNGAELVKMREESN
jgi:hypothetical protein